MALSKWIKENLVLAMGIFLPVVLVVIFMIASSVPKNLVNPPQYDFIFSYNEHSYQNPQTLIISFHVRQGNLFVKYDKTKNDNYYNKNHLYKYNASSQTVEEIFFDLPMDLENLKEGKLHLLKNTETLKIDKNHTSPDGYEFLYNDNYRHRGLVMEIFGSSSRYRNRAMLHKSGATHLIPAPNQQHNNRNYNYYYGNNINFIGWVTNTK